MTSTTTIGRIELYKIQNKPDPHFLLSLDYGTEDPAPSVTPTTPKNVTPKNEESNSCESDSDEGYFN